MSESCRKLIQPCAPRRLRLVMRTPLIIGVLVLLLNVHGNSANAELTRSGRELTEYRPHVLESSESDVLGLLVVTLLDGRMVAVRQDSGEVLWTYDTGSPLVTFQQGQAMPPGPRIIPGVDGGLYVYGTALAAPGSGGGGAAKLERLRTSLPELVDSSPSLTHDGSVILGKRLTRAYLLDRHTGVLLQGIREREPGGGGGGGSGAGYGAQDEMEDLSVDPALGLDLERVVVVGWEHYVVRSVQMETGAELWNATYSRCMFVRPAGQTSRLAGGGSLPGGGFSAASSSVPQFTLKADHTLQAHDPTSRIRRWAISFATPPVALFAGPYGDVNFLDPTVVGPPTPAASVPSPGPTAPGAGGGPALLPGPGGLASAPSVTAASSGGSGGGGGGGGGGKLALLGRLPTGGMYVMPAGHLLLDPQMEPISPGVPAITAGPGDTALAGDNTCGGTGGGFLATAPICRSSTPSTPSDLLPLPAAPSAAPSTAPGSCSSSHDNAVRSDLLSLPAAPSSAPSTTSSPSSPRGPGGAGGPTVSSPWVPATGGAGAVGGASRVSEDRALALIGTGQELVLPMSDDVDLLTEGEAGAVSGLSCHPGLQLLLNVDEPGAANPPLPWLPHAAQTAAAAVATGGSVNGSIVGDGEAAGWLLQWDGAQGAGGVVSLALLAAGAGAATAFVVLLYVRGGSGGAAAVAAGGLSGNKLAARLAAAAESGSSQVVAASRLGAAGVEVEVDAVAVGSGSGHAVSSSSGVGGSSGQEGGGKAGARTPTLAGSAGAAGGRRRKSGRTVGTAAADEVLAAPPSRPPALPLDAVPLPRIGEEEQLESAEYPPQPLYPAAQQTSATLGAAAAPFAAAPSLPSAETRVRVQADGSLAIGRLVVGPGILGYGSGGTIVYDGVLDGRPVAVKRLLRQFAALARKEIQVLILSDEHPNVVRCFAMEEDREFVYLALERCRSTLSDYLESPAGREAFLDPDSKQPTARCFSAMLDVCRGLAALHARGIVHRDLKPHNVLLTEGSLRAKLSDMGLSKTLVPEQSSFESHHGPGGSSGWQAPEQLIARDGGAARQTRSMDVFSLGCILYYCMTGGRHPFGDNHYERDANILHAAPSLGPLAATAGPEAAHLVAACLAKDPARRPPVAAVLSHPLWWGEERRLGFLVDISDRMEFEDRETDTRLVGALECFGPVALAGPSAALAPWESAAMVDAAGPGGTSASPATANSSPVAALRAALAACPSPNWGAVLPPDLVGNLGRYRRYDFTSLRDLLRVVRNKRNHFREMPPSLQSLLGPLPAGFLRFFSGRFPRLLLAGYVFALRHLAEDTALSAYWQGGQTDGGAVAAEEAIQPFIQTFLSQYGSSLKSPSAGTGASEGVSEEERGRSSGGGEPGACSDMQTSTNGYSNQDCGPAGSNPISLSTPSLSAPFSPSPLRPSAQLPGPPPQALTQPSQPAPTVLVGYAPSGEDGECFVREFPRRPGKQLCDFYVKTGHCKFGEGCVFDHPEENAVRLTAIGLPLRPQEPLCSFYLKNNECRFGPACKFHHPMLRPVFAGTAGSAVAAVMGAGVGSSGAASGDNDAEQCPEAGSADVAAASPSLLA